MGFVKVGLGTLFALGLVAGLSITVTASHHGHEADCALDPQSKPQCQDATVPEPPADDQVGEIQAIPKTPSGSSPSILDGVASFFGAVGRGVSDGAAAVGEGVAGAFVSIGLLVVGALRPVAELLASAKPAGMSLPLYSATVAGGTAAMAAGAQYGAWYGWRRLFPLGLPLVPLFSRIEKDELLENDRRARIFELIKNNPGIHLSEIARELEYAWGTTLHHLRKLRAERLILFKDIGHHKSFFVNGSGLSEKQMEALSLIKTGTLAQLAHYLEGHPRTTLKELSEALSISPPLAAFHIRKLEKAGLVAKVRDGKSVRLSTTEELPMGFFRHVAQQTPQLPEPEAAAS